MLALAAGGCRAKAPDAKVALLDEILSSRNDNDRRLDTAFDGLSAETKKLFREKYANTPPEKRNDRGVIVYLLGKNLQTPEDWAFLKDVAAEPPCLSMADCSKNGPGALGPGDEVTLAYPSLVALRQAAAKLPAPEAAAVVEAAKGSKVPAVVRMAARLSR